MPKFFIVFFALIHGCAVSSQETEISIDYAAASPALSIDINSRLPQNFIRNFVPVIFQALENNNNYYIEKAFKRDFTKYLQKVHKKLPENTGHLVKVQIYSNETGTKLLPPDFLIPSGVGVDPIDAYSNYLNTPTLQPLLISTGALINESYFIWVFKLEKRLVIHSIPREFTHRLIADANQVAMSKAKGEVYSYQPFSSAFSDYIEKAEFWNNEFKKYEEKLKQDGTFDKINNLKKEFNTLQLQQANLVQRYETLQRKMISNNSLLNTVEILLDISSKVVSTVKFIDSQNMNNKLTTIPDEGNIAYEPSIIKMQSKKFETELEVLNSDIEINGSKLKRKELELKNTFKVPALY